jgi:hypothetical protein
MEIKIILDNIKYTEYINNLVDLNYKGLVFSLQKIQKCVDYLYWNLTENKYCFYYGSKIKINNNYKIIYYRLL